MNKVIRDFEVFFDSIFFIFKTLLYLMLHHKLFMTHERKYSFLSICIILKVNMVCSDRPHTESCSLKHQIFLSHCFKRSVLYHSLPECLQVRVRGFLKFSRNLRVPYRNTNYLFCVLYKYWVLFVLFFCFLFFNIRKNISCY